MNKDYHKITDILYYPYGTTNEIIHNDRIIYITYFDLKENKNKDCIIDISYGLFDWLHLEKERYCNKVRKTNYRVIGQESLKEYMKNIYKIEVIGLNLKEM
jgi:hypothetical protein